MYSVRGTMIDIPSTMFTSVIWIKIPKPKSRKPSQAVGVKLEA